MTRDQLEELATWFATYGNEERSDEWYLRQAQGIRELLAQKPVGTIAEENFTQHVMVGVNGWHTLPGPRSAPILFKVLPVGTSLYAAPVPAVDLAQWKAEAMSQAVRLSATPPSLWDERYAALAAHLEKLGGK
jgi:hypothetical protein